MGFQEGNWGEGTRADQVTRERPRVKDLMTRDVLTLRESDSLELLDRLMKERRVRHVPIVDDDQRLVGLITQRDFLTVAVSKLAHLSPKEEAELYSRIRIGEVMGRKITVAYPETDLEDAARTIVDRKYGCLPVVDRKSRLVGILTVADFVKAFTV